MAQFATANEPRLRVQRGGHWQRVPLAYDYSGLFAADALAPDGINASTVFLSSAVTASRSSSNAFSNTMSAEIAV